MSRRDQIKMSQDEMLDFLESERVVVVASLGKDGWPHLMPLWYVVRDGELWGWTYGASQKVKNLERDPRCTLQVEAGHEYNELRGVMFKAEAVIHRDLDTVAGVGGDLAVRYGAAEMTDEVRTAMLAQAKKRVGLQFKVRDTASWDHRKLGGVY